MNVCASREWRRQVPSTTRPCARAWPPGSRRAPAPSRRRRASGATARASLAAFTPKRLASTAPSALTFISPKPGSASMLARSCCSVLCVLPHAGRVAVVLVADVDGEVVDAPGHRTGEAVDRRFLAEDRLEVDGGELRRRRACPVARAARAGRRRPSAPRPVGRARSRSAAPSGPWRSARWPRRSR